MDEILEQIHYYAQQLKSINMWQAAGDYDYISSFLDSPRWNDGEYYGVVPRGEETVDEYSHNCPIPFTANRCLVSRCYDNDKALEILDKLSEIFNTLKSDVSGDGLTAINAYIENTNRYIELLGGEPVPPGPEPPVYDMYYAGGIISPDASIDFVVTKPDKTFFTVDNISLTGFMIPTSVESIFYGNPSATSQNIVINNNDVELILYDSNSEPITDQSKLYGIKSIAVTGSGSVPVSVEENGWFKADHSTKSNISDMSWYSMYGDDGQPLPHDSSAAYSVTKAYLNDSEVTIIQYGRIYDENGYCILNIGLSGNSATKVIIQKTGSQSFTDLDTLRQMGLVSTYFDSQGRLRLKFPCASTGIAFTGTMDSVNVIVANKQQMTVDNIGLYGIAGPVGGITVKDYDYDFIVWSNGGLKFGVNELSQLEFVPVNAIEIEESTELVFVEPPQPTDRVLLYFLSGTTVKRQGYVTKTSSPNSNYVYPMYTSETVQDSTTLFVPEQDKIYRAGSIVDGDIKSYSERLPTRYVDKLSDMPSSTTSDGNADVTLYEFVDNGLWIASNFVYESTMSGKDSQWFKIEDVPAPPLPTVSYIGQLCVANKAQLAMNTDEVAALRKWDMNESIPYNSSYKYGASKYSSNGSQEYRAADKFKIQATPQGGSSILAVKNISGAAKVFYYIYAYSCDSPDATVITVYDSSNNPYNAFKYTSDGTDYYYVLDGTQTDWTDDLESIGYHVPPALPTVSMVISYIRQDKSRYYTAGGTYYLYDDSGNPIPWDSINSYQFFGTYESASSTTIDSGELYQSYQSVIESGGVVNYKNTGLGLYVQRVVFYSCSSSLATVITVYDSNNNPYNAFKYTLNGTDYYYVLDGTQTDWTDDLSSIGYHLPAQALELVVWVSDSTESQAFSSNDYWYSRIGSDADAQALIDFGGEVITDGQYKYIKVLNTFFYDLVNMYGATGTPILSAYLSNFWLAKGSDNHSGSLYIRSIDAYSTGIKTWKVHITENKDNVSWMMSDHSDVFIGYAGSHQLYDASGNAIPYDSTKTYTIVGYYTGADYVSLDMLTTANNQHFSFINYNSSGYLGIQSSNSSSNYRMQRVIYKIE